MAISLSVFAVVVGATAFGTFLNRVLPEHHLSKDSREIIHLRQCGPDAKEARDLLRRWVDDNAGAIWEPEGRRISTEQGDAEWSAFLAGLHAIAPASDVQRRLHERALDLTDELTQTRLLLAEQAVVSIQTPFLLVVVLWHGIIFTSFGLFAPRNGTVYAVIALSALSLSTAIFLILELDQPFVGTIRISDAPLHVLMREIHR